MVAEAATAILHARACAASDAGFLVAGGRVPEAAAYVVERRDQLDGDQWPGLLGLAESFAAADRPLAATLLYRALLDSILSRAQTRAYGHGARYLDVLGQLAAAVPDWGEIAPHPPYVAGLRARHGRKKSFWTRCGGAEAAR